MMDLSSFSRSVSWTSEAQFVMEEMDEMVEECAKGMQNKNGNQLIPTGLLELLARHVLEYSFNEMQRMKAGKPRVVLKKLQVFEPEGPYVTYDSQPLPELEATDFQLGMGIGGMAGISVILADFRVLGLEWFSCIKCEEIDTSVLVDQRSGLE
eukprot:6062239-Prymnesium_polylepis.1